jgi:hypothetical protein
VTLVLNTGERLSSGLMEARGDPEAPFDDAFMREKYRAYATPVLGGERTRLVEEAIDGLAEGGSLSRLTRLLTAPLP